MLERGEKAASEKKREFGRARTKHFPEYSPPRRFKPLKPGLLPLNSYFKTVNIHTNIASHSFLQFLYNARIQNTWKENVYGRTIFLRGRIAGSYPLQLLVIEPCVSALSSAFWNVFWILGRVLESGHCLWILENVLSVQATVLCSSLFSPASFCCRCFALFIFCIEMHACLGWDRLMHYFRPLLDSISWI